MKPIPTESVVTAFMAPVMTVERFAELVGLPVGVCEAQADRHLWPIIRIGKRRFINVELVRKKALEADVRK